MSDYPYREKLAEALRDARTSGGGAATATQDAPVEVRIPVSRDKINDLISQVEQDIEAHRALDEAVDDWSEKVLGDEKRAAPVIAMISHRVDTLAKARESQRNTRVGIGVSLGAVTLAAIFAIVGWIFNANLRENVDARVENVRERVDQQIDDVTRLLDSAVDQIPETVGATVNARIPSLREELIGETIEASDAKMSERVPEEVTRQLELEQLFLQATILSVQFDLGDQFSNDDRDRMLVLLERFKSEPTITDRQGFAAIVEKTLNSFSAASNESQLDRVVEMYPDVCFGRESISALLMQEYGRRLSSHPLPPSKWLPHVTEAFDRACASVPVELESPKLALQLLVATRAEGAPSEIGEEILTSATHLRAPDENAKDGRQIFVDWLLRNTHWAFISKRELPTATRGAETGREAIEAYRSTFYALADAVRPDLLADLVVNNLVNLRKQNHTRQEIREAAATLAELLSDRPEVVEAIGRLRQSGLV